MDYRLRTHQGRLGRHKVEFSKYQPHRNVARSDRASVRYPYTNRQIRCFSSKLKIGLPKKQKCGSQKSNQRRDAAVHEAPPPFGRLLFEFCRKPICICVCRQRCRRKLERLFGRRRGGCLFSSAYLITSVCFLHCKFNNLLFALFACRTVKSEECFFLFGYRICSSCSALRHIILLASAYS